MRPVAVLRVPAPPRSGVCQGQRTALFLAGVLAVGLGIWSTASAQSYSQTQSTSSSATSLAVNSANGQTVVTLNGRQVYAGPSRGQVTSRSSNVNGVEYAAVFDGDLVLWENTPGAAQQLPAPADPVGSLAQQPPAVPLLPADLWTNMTERKFKLVRPGKTNTSRVSFGGSAKTGSSAATGVYGQAGAGGTASSVTGSTHGTSTQAGGRTVSSSTSASIGVKVVNGSAVVTYQGREYPVGPTQGRISTKSRSDNGTNYAAAFDDDRVIWENVPGAAEKLQ